MNERWSTQDLERFLDGDLDPAAARELSESLLSDRDLRRRFAAVRRADDLARAALSAPSTRSFPALRLAIAAALVLAAALGLLLLRSAPTPGPSPDPGPAPHRVLAAVEQPAESERGVRFVMSLPYVERAPRQTPDAAPRAQRPEPVHQPPIRRADSFERALAQGNIGAAAAFIHEADDAGRAEAIRRVSTLLRSASTALRLLDSLPEELQVQACREMAAELALRPVALGRLRELASRPALAQSVRDALDQLSQDPSIRVWLDAGYAPS